MALTVGVAKTHVHSQTNSNTHTQTDTSRHTINDRHTHIKTQIHIRKKDVEKHGRIHGHRLRTGGQGRKCAFSQFWTRAHGPTDRRTDRRTDKGSYRVACPQLKIQSQFQAHKNKQTRTQAQNQKRKHTAANDKEDSGWF